MGRSSAVGQGVKRTHRSSSNAGDGVVVGFFHPWTFARDASGLTVYTRRLSEALADRTGVYLYAADGDTADDLTETAVEPVTTRFGRLDLPLSFPSATPVTVSHHLNRYPYYAKFLAERRHRHVEATVDVIVTNDYLDELFVSNVIDVPTIRIIHGQPIGLAQDVRETVSRAALTLANSAHTARNIEFELGYEADGIVTPGVDLDRFRPNIPPAFDEEGTTILYAGRLVEGKGIAELIDALALQSGDCTLHLVGRGKTETIRERAIARGVEDDIVVHGPVSHDELPGYYAAADIFCNPSHYESFGMVNLEAMACGTPVVTTALDVTREYITSGETGVLVPPNDHVALAGAIDRLATAQSRRQEMGRAARAVAETYTWERSASRLEGLCLSLLEPTTGVRER